MKKSILLLVVLTTNLLCIPVFSQAGDEPEALGLPGDNLNLYAVLNTFQKSPTLEEFERTLNDEQTNINNLDLNDDNAIDYIEVVANKANKEGDFSIVLRVATNNAEYQDVAVIEGHKNSMEKVIIQIIGDEDLYGKDYIVEPSPSETQNTGYVGNQRVIKVDEVYYANDWPIVVYLVSPRFSVYTSPSRWDNYPTYWHPRRPVFFRTYWGFHRHYYTNNFYRRFGYVRNPNIHSYSVKRRNASIIVKKYKIENRYNRTYEGRIYKKPVVIRRTRIVTPNHRKHIKISKKIRPKSRDRK